jgi:formylmethanofuran--tetrahydromethanopterin N-formyltransferase
MARIENTFAEAFDGLFLRLILTAKDPIRLKQAAYDSTALPSVVINRTEGGIEKWLTPKETPDQRLGALIQFWGQYRPQHAQKSVDTFYEEVSYRIRQGILVVPTTALYDANNANDGDALDAMIRIGHCGDGYEWEETLHGRHIIRVPLMMGTFVIERYLRYNRGVMGGNLWLLCRDEEVALAAGDAAISAIREVEGVITPFNICAAGSKPETRFPHIGPTTNHPYCPSLRHRIPDSHLPPDVSAIPEIVINGVSLSAVKRGMLVAIQAVQNISGVEYISAGNYGGKLGQHQIHLHELIA